jgi:hypothetical protein
VSKLNKGLIAYKHLLKISKNLPPNRKVSKRQEHNFREEETQKASKSGCGSVAGRSTRKETDKSMF